jgi:hypothetical protein
MSGHLRCWVSKTGMTIGLGAVESVQNGYSGLNFFPLDVPHRFLLRSYQPKTPKDAWSTTDSQRLTFSVPNEFKVTAPGGGRGASQYEVTGSEFANS